MNENRFLHGAEISDRFWSALRETVRREGIPYQWKALNDQLDADAEKSYCMRNFHIAAGREAGEHGGYVFQDSDVAKWIEGAAYSLTWHPDAELEKTVDGAIDDIVAAQQPDGYMDTYYIINGLEKRWTNLMDHHELYCAGHMIEAAVAYYQATGKRKLLDAVIRLVAHINSVLGAEEGKLHGYPGHPIIEMALMRLYEVTGDPMHKALAAYFINERGQSPLFFKEEMARNNNRCGWMDGPLGLSYYQADKPLREQKDAAGHAVRALYLYSGLADVARETGDESLAAACHTLWQSVARRRMYITGAVGSSRYGEAFSYDYDLPNDTVYGETCAAIALVFFARRMLQMETRGEYADVMERALYNGVISGMQLDGKKFFYVNPLEVVPEACVKDQQHEHVKPERQKWFGCACCPPNLVRMLTSLQDYLYSSDGETLCVHLYAAGRASARLAGQDVAFSVETRYPWDGDIAMKFAMQGEVEFRVALRVPGWCGAWTLEVNGAPCAAEVKDGYAYLARRWRDGDTIRLRLEMPAVCYRANQLVRKDADKLAVMRGPIVYCLEECDNGKNLHLLHLGAKRNFETEYEAEELGGIVRLNCEGEREILDAQDEPLYTAEREVKKEPAALRFIPYYAWANRGVGEMTVWVRE